MMTVASAARRPGFQIPPALLADPGRQDVAPVGRARLETLVLNSDYRPLRTMPLSVWTWQDAAHAALKGRVDVVATYDRVARSAHAAIAIPSVVALRDYQPTWRPPAFTRHNLLLRDRFTCAYCGQVFPTSELTFDHVRPRSRGGHSGWTNILSACREDNFRKANRTPDEARMQPLWEPWEPTVEDLNRLGQRFLPRNIEKSWLDFLYWHVPLEE